MSNRRIISISEWCVVATCVVATANLASAKDRDGAAGKKGTDIMAIVKRAGHSIAFNGSILVAENGKVLTACAAGFADAEADEPNCSTTLFEIASATKPFTAIAICQLVDEGKLQLDDSIADYLPGVPDSCKAITVRHLIQHTSGIPGSNSQGAGDDLAVVLPLFLKGGPKSPPGSKWEYWNQGYSLLSEVIARVSGISYTEYCRKKIFEPAKMTATCFTGETAPNGTFVAIGTSTKGRSRSALDHPYGSYGFQYRGMGGIVTNVWDLWRWDSALSQGRLLTPKLMEEMFTPGLGDYGLGWYLGTDPDGRLVQRHSGKVRGFVCELRRYPQNNGCIFVLSNRDDARLNLLVAAIEQVLLDKKNPSVMIPRGVARKQQAFLIGTYKNRRNQVLSIESHGTSTKGTIDWGGPVTHGFIGINDEQEFVFFDGTNTKLSIDRKKKPFVAITLGKTVFHRQTIGDE